MDSNFFIINTMIASLSFITPNTATASHRYFILPEKECHSPLTNIVPPTSTRFSNSQRYSLEQLRFNKMKLQSFKNLESNWNGYNGQSFDESLIGKIETILSSLEYQPQIFPTGRGSIQIEKYINDENLVEIEISNNEIFAFMVKNGFEQERIVSIEEIKDIISELYA